MNLLDRIRAAMQRSPAPPATTGTGGAMTVKPFFVGWRAAAPQPAHHLGTTPVSDGTANRNPTSPPPGPEQTTWPALEPVPAFYVDVAPQGLDRPAFMGPQVEALMHSGGVSPS